MSWTRDLRKLGARSWSERALLLEAFVWLGVMRAAMRRMPFRRIAARLGLTPVETFEIPQASKIHQATRIGWAVRVAASRTPWQSTCLVQALAGIAMLRRRKIAGVLYLGIAKDAVASQPLAAHAWLGCGDVILTGERERERFSMVSCFVG
jgi:hypothetical protein